MCILKEKGHSFEKYLETSVWFHRYELTNWLNENYKCEHVFIPKWKTEIHVKREHWPSAEPISVQYLIEKWANNEAKDEDQWTPLHFACEYGYLPIVHYLIEKRANIEAKDLQEKTPLHIAYEKQYTQIVEFLIDHYVQLSQPNTFHLCTWT